MNNRMGFWSVLALVIGSQIGSGVFMLPASLAVYGKYSIAGWITSAIGAISLALVFASLCSRFPKTGGPHVYAEQIFGRDISFFTGWTYWVISWVSTTAVIVASIGYLSPIIGNQEPTIYLVLEIFLLIIVGMLNLYGVEAAGKAETLLTILKFILLFLIPLFALWYFDISNLTMSEKISYQLPSSNIAQTALLTLWGFVGLECATAPAGSVENPSKTIPKALVIGTLTVAIIYMFNSVAIMGLIKGEELASSNAPYVLAAEKIFGGNWSLWISIAASIACIGTLNAWVLTSGQISLGLAEDKMMPNIFACLNKNKSPYASIIISCIGIIPLLILTANKNIAAQVTTVIDFSVTSFLFIYLLCSIAQLILCLKEKTSIFNILNAIIALSFCLWVISETSLNTILISSLFTLSGIPLYVFWFKKQSS